MTDIENKITIKNIIRIMIMHLQLIFLLFLTLGVSGCVQYWSQPGVDLKQTSADLHDCRMEANKGGQKVFTARELEMPCMASKGYDITYSPHYISK